MVVNLPGGSYVLSLGVDEEGASGQGWLCRGGLRLLSCILQVHIHLA